jgi:hypothetical protein
VATQILAFHFVAGHTTALTAESTIRSLRATGFASGASDDPGIAALLQSRQWDRVLCTLPADAAFFRFLDLPFRDRRRLAQAVGPALEEHVPVSLDDATTAFDVSGSARSSSRSLAALVRHATIDERVVDAATIAVPPTLLVWQPCAVMAAYRRAIAADSPWIMVDVGIENTIVASIGVDEVLGIRVIGPATDTEFARDLRWAVRTLEPVGERLVLGGPLWETAAQTVAEALDGSRVECLPEDCPLAGSEALRSVWRTLTAAVGLVLVASGESEPPVLSFAAGGARAEDARTQWRDAARVLAPWVILSVVLVAAAAAMDYGRLYRETSRLDRTAERIFSTAMPGVPGGSGRRTKLELKQSELEARRAELSGAASKEGALGILVTLSETIPADLGVEFETYAYDPPNVRMRGQGTSFEVVTRLQQLLRESTPFQNIDVGDVRSAASGSGVEFELTIRLAGKAS